MEYGTCVEGVWGMVGQTALIACILLTGSARATEDAETATLPAPRAWRIAPEVSHYRYKEPGVMTNEGTLYGIVGSYTFRSHGEGSLFSSGSRDSTTITLEGRLGFGEMDYDGSDMYTNEPLSINGIDDFLLDLRMLWGRERPEARLLNGVHAGLGYRYLNDDSSSQLGGYERESNYLYVPLDARKDFELADRWTLSLKGEFDMLLIGRQISHLDEADPTLPEVRTWQWPGFGAGLALDLRHTNRNIDLALSPFLRYWWVDDSSTSEGYYEPENNTFEYGLSFVVRF
jgi:hypothetical protein